MRNGWNQAQISYLNRHPDASPHALAEPISKLGPYRTASAILEKRRTLRHSGRITDQDQSSARSAAARGWPAMNGTEEQRDEEYVRRVYQAALQEGVPRKVYPQATSFPVQGQNGHIVTSLIGE